MSYGRPSKKTIQLVLYDVTLSAFDHRCSSYRFQRCIKYATKSTTMPMTTAPMTNSKIMGEDIGIKLFIIACFFIKKMDDNKTIMLYIPKNIIVIIYASLRVEKKKTLSSDRRDVSAGISASPRGAFSGISE